MSRRKGKRLFIYLLAMIMIFPACPSKVSGKVKTITDMQDKLNNVSDKQKDVLEKLFSITQEMDGLKLREEKLNKVITVIKQQIYDKQVKIDNKQKDYNQKLSAMKQVLVSYQRSGPASYLEILIKADNLSDFLKSINLIKDISHNEEKLLNSLKEGKKALLKEKEKLKCKKEVLAEKKKELAESFEKKQQLKKELKLSLASLNSQSTYYTDQLSNLKQMWDDCKSVFAGIVGEISNVAGNGYFTVQDLNLNFGFKSITGSLKDTDFNQILKEHSKLPQTLIHFHENQVTFEIPEKKLIVNGKFIIHGATSILFKPETGSFYDIPLNKNSIYELFQKEALLIDFKKLAGDMVTIDFSIKKVESREGYLSFEIKPEL